jgi:YidC/Oxa1 family membrane protein insertase
MFQLIANVLAWFYGLTHNYIFSIALLTISIMLLLTPLTLKGTKSMLEMQKLQPEIKRLQAEHKGDRQKLNEEMMKLYQEHKINPLGGCLPLLLQAPVFIILLGVISHLTQECSANAHAAGKCTNAVGVQAEIGHFVPGYVSKTSELFNSLFNQTSMMQWGLDLSKPATYFIRESFLEGLPYLLLVGLVAATSYIQQWQISARTQSSQINKQQQMIMKLMPAFFAVIALTLPSALIIYFLTSNLFRIAQQYYITRKFYKDNPSTAAVIEAKAKPAPTTPKPEPKAVPKPAPAPRHAKPSGRTTPPKGSATPNRPTPRTKPSTPPPDPKKKK